MTADPLLSAALRHWGARAVPFSDCPGEEPYLSPEWQRNLSLLQQTAALRSVMLLCGDNGVGKSALVSHWVSTLEPKAYCPLVITQATLSGSGLLAVLLGKLGQPGGLLRSRWHHRGTGQVYGRIDQFGPKPDPCLFTQCVADSH